MTRRRIHPWSRLISGLYVPPLLSFAGNPYPCGDCCCIACLGANYPASLNLEVDGWVDDTCTDCDEFFNKTWNLPLAIPCVRDGDGFSVTYSDEFLPGQKYVRMPFAVECIDAMYAIKWDLLIQWFTGDVTAIQVEASYKVTSGSAWFLFGQWRKDALGGPHNCMNFTSLDIPITVAYDPPTDSAPARCGSTGSPAPAVALTTP